MSTEAEVNILICCTGSVATIKLPELLECLVSELGSKCALELKVCLTEKAKHFCDSGEIDPIAKVCNDDEEWATWEKRGDPVLHIELSKWADIIIIAPLDANTLGKIASVSITYITLCCSKI